MFAALLSFALAAAPAAPSAAPLQFIEDDYAMALARAKKSKVPLFVDAWAPWCHSCVFMREHVLNRPELSVHGQKFVFLSIDTEKESNAAFLQKFPVEVWPTLFIIDATDEKAAMQFQGSVDVERFGKLLGDGQRAVAAKKAGGADAAAKLAKADRLLAEKQFVKAARAYGLAIETMKPEFPTRGRAIESWLNALYLAKEHQECVDAAIAFAHKADRDLSFTNIVGWGLSCLGAADAKAPWRTDAGEQLLVLGRDALTRDGVLADDKSGIYESLVDLLGEKGDGKGKEQLAIEWLSFLEVEANKASNAKARAAFDPHRVNAAIAAKQPARAVDALLQTEKDLPDDYNAPARLALLYRELGKYDDALAAADRALAKVYGPRKVRVLETKASIQAKKGDAEGQKATLTEAREWATKLPKGQLNPKTVARLDEQLSRLKPAAPKAP